MQGYLSSLSLILLIGMVIFRVSSLRKNGISAMLFGKIDKKDFGIRAFVRGEKDRWTCIECGGTICVHRGFCTTYRKSLNEEFPAGN